MGCNGAIVDARRPTHPSILRWRMQEGIDFYSLPYIAGRHTMFDWQRKYSMSYTHAHYLLCRQTLFPSVLTPYNIQFTRALFSFLLFLLSWNWSTSETSKTSLFFCLFVIFIPNEILGEKIILTKNTYTRIQKVWLEFGCSKMERVQHQLWANEYDRFDHYRCGTSPSILQQSIVLLALRKKCTTTTNVQNFTSIEQKIRLFLKYFCGQISKKKKKVECWERNRKELKFPPR